MVDTKRISSDEIRELASEFVALVGAPILTIEQAAKCLGRSVTSVRAAVYSGQLVGSRPEKNGRIYFTAKAIAAYFLAGRERSLPDLSPEAIEARRERGRRRRKEASKRRRTATTR